MLYNNAIIIFCVVGGFVAGVLLMKMKHDFDKKRDEWEADEAVEWTKNYLNELTE